jgi:hypothetical protein
MQTNKLEQHCVLKPGSTCLVGNCFHGVPWCEKVMEYLLAAAMKRQNFNKIYILPLDKRLSNLITATECTEDGNLCVFKSMDDLVSKLTSSVVSKEGSTAIFLYSLSELILRTSLRKATAAFQQLLSLTYHKESNVHLFTFINSSLHDLSTISYLTAMVDAVVTIIPNDGSSLSLEVAAEVHIVRRSQSSTKISEDIEMLEWRDSRLQPRLSVRVVDAPVEETSVVDATSNEVKVFNKSHSRLITFESTDPEFDDDDDPDADLDL